jgi:transcriptional regulator with PAS, ATPase and Fis domain
MKKDNKAIHPKALQTLLNHEWPGNVRELQNVIERIVALHTGETLTEKDVIEHITIFQSDEEYDFLDYSFEKAKELFEKRYIENLFRKFPKNLQKASLHAKVHPATLYRKLNQHKIQK